jgi:hypothetical protein
MTRVILPNALLLATLIAMPARGESAAIRDVEVGFGGAYKVAEWMPIKVEVGFSGAAPAPVAVEVVTTDAEGSSVVQRLSATQSGAEEHPGSASPLRVRGIIQAGRLGSDLTVRVLDEAGASIAERRLRAGTFPTALTKGTKLWVTAGGLNIKEGDELRSTLPAPEPGVVAGPLADPLPSDHNAYASIDVLIARGDFSPSAEEAEAIRQWVAGGGQLAVALGRFTDEFRRGPFAQWMPIEVGETTQLRDLSRIEEFVGADRRLPARASRRARVAQLGDSAEVVLPGADGPLIARSPFGFGTVTLFAFDLDELPFSTWSGRPNLIRRALLGTEVAKTRSRRISVPGVTDVATQWARAEDSFPNVERTSVGAALLLLLFYAAVIGPLDYLLVHRVLRRPALTWVTLPLLVCIAGWWLHGLAVEANGEVSQFNQTGILDIDAATATIRGRTAVTLYATDSTQTDVAIAPRSPWLSDNQKSPPRLEWFSPPEATFGGAFRDASGSLFRPEYLLGSMQRSFEAERVPQLIWSSRRFVATWQTKAPRELVSSDLVSRGRGILAGKMTHHLPGALRDVVVVFDDQIFVNPYESEWHPGEALDVSSAAFERTDLGAFLRRRVTTRVEKKAGESGAEFLVADTAYDPLGSDPAAIFRILTFYNAAGGSDYTGLANDVLASHDFTHLMRMGRAVVLGRLDTMSADVTIAARSGDEFQPARQTQFVRIALPVFPDESEPPATLPLFETRDAGETPPNGSN